MAEWVFTLRTSGSGQTPKEAWLDAIDTITSQLDEFLDPDDIPECEVDPDSLSDG